MVHKGRTQTTRGQHGKVADNKVAAAIGKVRLVATAPDNVVQILLVRCGGSMARWLTQQGEAPALQCCTIRLHPQGIQSAGRAPVPQPVRTRCGIALPAFAGRVL